MGNRITRTVLFAASALLSVSAFGAGAARLGTLRNADWVVTNAWQAVSNKTHDLIIDLGQEASLPPNWLNVSNAAMSAVQSLQPATNYTDRVADEFEQGERVARYAWVLVGGNDWTAERIDEEFADVRQEIADTASGVAVRATNYTDRVAAEFADGTRVVYSSFEADYANNAEHATWADRADYADILKIGADGISARELIQESTNAAEAVADAKISTNNAAFVAAVLAAPLAGANADDLSEIAEYGSYGTVGAALLALIAGLAALKRRMATAETSISGKLDGARAYPEWDGTLGYVSGELVWRDGAVWVAVEDIPQASPGPGDNSSWARNFGNLYSKILEKQDALTEQQLANIETVPDKADAADLRYALVTPEFTAWEYQGMPDGMTESLAPSYYDFSGGIWNMAVIYDDQEFPLSVQGNPDAMELTFEETILGESVTVVATRSYALIDRASNAVTRSADATLTLPPAVPGRVRDLIVRMTVSTSADVTFLAQAGETVAWDSSGDPSGTRAPGTHLLRLTEVAQGVWHCEDMLALVGLEAALAAINGGVAP